MKSTPLSSSGLLVVRFDSQFYVKTLIYSQPLGEQPPERWQKSPIYNMVKKHVDENKVHRFSM